MIDREKVIKGITHHKLGQCDMSGKICPYWKEEADCMRKMLGDALALLKEQDSEKERIMKVIWDALHEGFSIDTIADQDWVYEQIRHRIEDT